jgi:rare lipoprotein A
MKYFFFIFTIVFLLTGCSDKQEPTLIVKKSKHPPKLKPYKVLGKWYYPIAVEVGDRFQGIASWYGPNFHGKLTANGEVYNMYAYTAANKILPMGTKVRVTNLKNGKSVVVRINDRGPFVEDRIIDVSYIAGKKLGLNKSGTAPVELIVVETPYLSKKVTKKRKIVKKNGKIKIQIGAFRRKEGAFETKRRYKKYGKKVFVSKVGDKYKVFIGYFYSRNEAMKFKNRFKIKGFIID